MRPTGILVVNLGTPEAPTPSAVRRYLRQFLGDSRVLQMPALLRYLLLNLLILPLRSRRSAQAYQKIWTAEGSPIQVHGRALVAGLRQEFGSGFRVELAMRYGEPSIACGLKALAAADCRQIIVLPLFPQYATSTWGSAVAEVYEQAAHFQRVLPVHVVPPFFNHPQFISAFADVVRPTLDTFQPDHVLISFHGLPESHIRAADANGVCAMHDGCCLQVGVNNRFCYRAQCLATARCLADSLQLRTGNWRTSFQSRLGRQPWLRPYTDQVLSELATSGAKRVAVLCPSFVADNLETIEEIAIEGREHFRKFGGSDLICLPSLNADAAWVAAVKTIIEDAMRL